MRNLGATFMRNIIALFVFDLRNLPDCNWQ
jgi:hypothetical protein